jgi:hypothetical protein
VQNNSSLERLEDVVIAPGFVVGHDVGHKNFLPAAYSDFNK